MGLSMNRRGILKLLGAATVGTLAHEQLLWLARAPVSVSSRVLEPDTVSITVNSILPEDRVTILPSPMGTFTGGAYIDSGIERDVVVKVRNKTIKPFVVNA